MHHTIATYLPNCVCLSELAHIISRQASHIEMTGYMFREEEVTEEMLSINDDSLIDVFGKTPDMPDSLEVWRTNITRAIGDHCGNKEHRLNIALA